MENDRPVTQFALGALGIVEHGGGSASLIQHPAVERDDGHDRPLPAGPGAWPASPLGVFEPDHPSGVAKARGGKRDKLSALQYPAPQKRQIQLINDARNPGVAPTKEDSRLTSLGRFSIALACLALTMACAWGVRAQDCLGAPSATRLILSVDGVRTAEGYVVATVFGPDPSRYLVQHGELFSERAPAQAGAPPCASTCPRPAPMRWWRSTTPTPTASSTRASFADRSKATASPTMCGRCSAPHR